MNNYKTYDAVDRWYKLMELFPANPSSSCSKYQDIETNNSQQESFS